MRASLPVLLLLGALCGASAVHGQLAEALDHFTKFNRNLAKSQSQVLPSLQSRDFAAQQQGSNALCSSAAYQQSQGLAYYYCDNFNGLPTFFDTTNSSAAAVNGINSMCASQCQNAISSHVKTYGSCLQASYRSSLAMVSAMCTIHDGKYCAVRIRSLATISCASANPASCGANGTMCKFNTDTGSCEPWVNTAGLQEVCTPCFNRYLLAVSQLVGSGESQAQANVVARMFQSMNEMMCAKVGNDYCMPILQAVSNATLNFTRQNNDTLPNIQANITATCRGNGAQCVRKSTSAMVALVTATQDLQVMTCQQAAFSTTTRTRCSNVYAATVTEAVRIQNLANYMCVNSAANGSSCLMSLHRALRDECVRALDTTGSTCNSTCAAAVQSRVQDMGCCSWLLYEASNSVYDYEGARFDVRRYLSRPAQPSRAWESSLWHDEITKCNTTTNAAAGYDATATRTAAESNCSAIVASVKREFKLVGLRWSAISANATLKQRVVDSFLADLLRSTGGDKRTVTNVTVEEDTTQKLTTTTTTARRQATASNVTSGTKISFQTTSDTAASYDSSALQLTSTGNVIQEECTTCMGAPTAAPGATAAPPPTGNLFAALAGQDASGTGTSPTASPAAIPAAVLTLAGTIFAVCIAIFQ